MIKKIDVERWFKKEDDKLKSKPERQDKVLDIVDDIIINRSYGISITYTWVYFFILILSIFLFLILVIEDFLYNEIFGYASLELFVPPIIASIISYLFVLKKDKYLLYFTKFDKMPRFKIIRQFFLIIICLTVYFFIVYWQLHY